MNPNPTGSADDGDNQDSRSYDNKKYTFTYVMESYLKEKYKKKRLYSPWHIFEGYLWRLLIFPLGNDVNNYISVYLDCGGPVDGEASAKCEGSADGVVEQKVESNDIEKGGKTPGDSWHCSARFWLYLVAPGNWVKSGNSLAKPFLKNDEKACPVDTEGATSTGADGSRSDSKLALDIIKDSVHKFEASSCDWGYHEFAPLRLLKPGRYCDDNCNVMFKVNIRITPNVDC